MVLGRIALKRGDIENAKRHLMACADGSGSPVLSSFGPDMKLARDLLDRAEKDAVLEFLEMCATLYTHNGASYSQWAKMINDDQQPDFGL